MLKNENENQILLSIINLLFIKIYCLCLAGSKRRNPNLTQVNKKRKMKVIMLMYF